MTIKVKKFDLKENYFGNKDDSEKKETYKN